MTDRQRTERLVSVIVPVYNVEKWLDECVQSIVSQSYDDLEIILVDDGSTDSSAALCDACAARYGNVSVIHKPNGGPSSARNVGIEAASGKWLLFCDSDDVICDTDCIRKLVDYATEYELDLLRFECRQVDENLNPLSCGLKDKSGVAGRLLTNYEFIQHAVDGEWFGVLFLIKRDIVGDLRFDEDLNYLEDVYFFAGLLSLRPLRCGYLGEAMYLYRNHTGSLARTPGEKQLVCQLRVTDFLYECSVKSADRSESAYYREQSVLQYYYMLQTLAKECFNSSRDELIERLHLDDLHERVLGRLRGANIDTK